MGKKRGKDKSSREDDDIDLSGPSCRHIKKGTDQTLLKKLGGDVESISCQDCKHEENKENGNSNSSQDCEEENETPAAWMCLKCGHRGCGRQSENQHAIKHYETPRSDPHCLVVSMDNWSVWCYICDEEVQYSRTGHLAQLVTNLKKQTTADSIKRPQKRVKEEVEVEVEQKTATANADESEDKENKEVKNDHKKTTKKESVGKSQNSSKTEVKSGVSVKGLSNLGNTCFFNAVIQNLSQTQLLRQTLNKVTGEKMEMDINPGASSELEPVAVHLEHPGSLTVAMRQLLNEIQETKKGVVTPRELFTQVCKKAARFKGFQQQDSQELLRYLLDGMRAEEIKRVSVGIMEALKRSRKDTEGEQLKTLVKEYEKHSCAKNFVDQVFGGEMTSTIMCRRCETVSVVTEMFLDLSLPVSDETYRKKNQKKVVQKTSESSQDGRDSPAAANGSEDGPVGGGSKYQQKKAKKQAKKQAKHQKRQQKFEDRVTLDTLASPGSAESEQTDPPADAEKNGESETNEGASSSSEGNSSPSVAAAADQAAQNPDADQAAQDPDADQAAQNPDADQAEGGIEEDADSEAVDNRFTVLSDEQDSKDGLADDGAEQEAEDEAQLADEMERVTLDDAFAEDSEETGDESPQSKEYTVVNQDPELAFQPLAARASPGKQECSVQSCLFQFTEVETLTQTNSLLCVTCTKRHGNKDDAAGPKKNVYTDALKQMLISSPPPVLTLHLKRFQQNGYSICKVNRHVQFPLMLDLAPFCGVKCKNTAEGDSSQILYGLYGIVEHSGTMRSGHYTAYVRVRPECPEPTSNGLSGGGREPSSGSWFHISDTSVTPVSESKVQSCQAYLLFYERIL